MAWSESEISTCECYYIKIDDDCEIEIYKNKCKCSFVCMYIIFALILFWMFKIQHNGVKFCYKANEVQELHGYCLKATNKILKQITQSKLIFFPFRNRNTKYWKQCCTCYRITFKLKLYVHFIMNLCLLSNSNRYILWMVTLF